MNKMITRPRSFQTITEHYHFIPCQYFGEMVHLYVKHNKKEETITAVKVPIAANWKGVCLQNTSKSHSYHLKIWHLL